MFNLSRLLYLIDFGCLKVFKDPSEVREPVAQVNVHPALMASIPIMDPHYGSLGYFDGEYGPNGPLVLVCHGGL